MVHRDQPVWVLVFRYKECCFLQRRRPFLWEIGRRTPLCMKLQRVDSITDKSLQRSSRCFLRLSCPRAQCGAAHAHGAGEWKPRRVPGGMVEEGGEESVARTVNFSHFFHLLFWGSSRRRASGVAIKVPFASQLFGSRVFLIPRSFYHPKRCLA